MRTQIPRSAYVCCILGLLLSIEATGDESHPHRRPQALEEAATISPPGPNGQIVRRVALSGDHLLMATRRNTDRPEGPWSEQFAHLFRLRRDASWVHVRTLATTSLPNQETPPMAVDLSDRVAAVNAGELKIFERRASDWKLVVTLPSSGNLDLEIDAGTIVVSQPGCAWEAFHKRENRWIRVGFVSPSQTCNANPGFGEDIDISRSRIVLANPFISGPQGTQWPSRVRVYEDISSTTPAAFITAPLVPDQEGFGIPVAVDKQTVFAGRGALVLVFERGSGGMWTHQATLEPADSMMLEFAASIQVARRPYSRGISAGSAARRRRRVGGSVSPRRSRHLHGSCEIVGERRRG